MKNGPLILAAFLALCAASLWLWKITSSGAEPPARLIRDMELPTGRPHLPPPPGAVPFDSPAAEAAPEPNGAALFSRYCATCHGEDGSGQSFVASQPGMPDVSNLTQTDSTADELYRTLSEGRGAMPSFGSRLSEAERRQLILFLQTLHRP